MRRLRLIFATLIIAVFSYQPILDAWRGFKGVHTENGVLTCEYDGRSYHKNDQRRADDACNVCTCGENGWACTQIACTTGNTGFGTISGALSSPHKSSVEERVCAVNLKDDKEYCQQIMAGDATYVIPAPAGSYWVYALVADDQENHRAYYSEFIPCGRTPACKDHSPVTVALEAGAIAHADPQDWDVSGQIDLLNVTPSKWEYNTHNYYPNSSFFVKSRGLSKVEIFGTPYPPHDGDPATLVGEAVLVSTDRDVQTWSLPVPQGFQTTFLHAVGTTASGDYMSSRQLWLVRPIEGEAARSE